MKASLILITGLSLLAVGCAPAAQSDAARAEEPINKTQMNNTKMNTMTPALKTLTSSHDFAATTARALAAIEKRPLNLFAQIDHAAGAAKAGLTLAPSTLFIFGNPKGGTPLMTRNPQMGLVLPLKLHVYQDGDQVKVSYTDIAAEAKQHGLDSDQLPVPNIVKMLDGLAAEITG